MIEITTEVKTICRFCGRPVERVRGIWMHTDCSPRHPAVPKRLKRTDGRYPMSDDQPAQIDCRRIDCVFNGGAGQCTNVSPAITLNEDRTAVCWSYEVE